jgi:hypothetical protein
VDGEVFAPKHRDLNAGAAGFWKGLHRSRGPEKGLQQQQQQHSDIRNERV